MLMGHSNAKIVLKSAREVELMRAAGQLVRRVLDELGALVKPGATTAQLNQRAADLIREAGATALFLGVRNPEAKFPFPGNICASVNEEIVHGIPNDRPLKPGDIVSVDCGVRLKGYCGDSAHTFAVGNVSARTQKLLSVTRETLDIALNEMKPFMRWSQIAKLMQKHVEENGFGVVRQFVGHGIGREMHEEPKVPNYYERGQRNADFELVPGMTLAIEPMVTGGRPDVDFKDKRDCWTIITKDRSLAAHYEHTVAVTNDGIDILTV